MVFDGSGGLWWLLVAIGFFVGVFLWLLEVFVVFYHFLQLLVVFGGFGDLWWYLWFFVAFGGAQ